MQIHEQGGSPQLTNRFIQAVDYARQVHVGLRKGTEVPYMAHLLGVASLVLGESGHVPFPMTEDIAIAALLHDAVEDEGGLPRLRDIESKFGKEVAKIVEGCTDSRAWLAVSTATRRRHADLRRKVQLFQELGIARVMSQPFKKRIDFHSTQAGVTLFVGAVQPLKGLIRLAAISVYFSDLIRHVCLVVRDELCQSGVRIAGTIEGVVS